MKTKKIVTSLITIDAFSDILGGILLGFILNKIYEHFFNKNKLIFAIFLLIGCFTGLLNYIKRFINFKK